MEERKKELKKVKQIIKQNIEDYDCGIFDTKNVAGDNMHNIFTGKYFTLDGCHYWSYYELFGTTEEEFKEIEVYYEKNKGW